MADYEFDFNELPTDIGNAFEEGDVVSPTAMPTAAPTAMSTAVPTAIPIQPAPEASTFEMDFEDFDPRTPLESLSSLNGISRYAIIGKEPVYNVQNVLNAYRIPAQLFFDTGAEKKAYLEKNIGNRFDIAIDPKNPAEVVTRRKGAKVWGRVDPNESSLNELVTEAGENVDLIAQSLALPPGLITGALTSGGIQGLRQLGRQALLPGSDIQGEQMAIDAIAGGIAGKFNASNTAKLAAKGATKGFQQGKNMYQAVSEADKTQSLLSRIRSAPDILDSPEWVAREAGATGKQFDDFQKKAITENIAYLQKNVPEFNEARKALTIKGRYENLQKLLVQKGTEMSEAISKAAPVTIKELFDTNAFKSLIRSRKGVVSKGRSKVSVDDDVIKGVNKEVHSMLKQLGRTYLTKENGMDKYLTAYSKNRLHKDPDLSAFGFKTNDEAMMGLIGGSELTLNDLQLMKMGASEKLSWGKRAGDIKSLSSARKLRVDAYKQVIEKALLDQGMPDAVASIKAYHELFPVVSTFARTVGGDKAATLNMLRTLPNTFYSTARFVPTLMQNLIRKPEIAQTLRNLSNPISGKIGTLNPLPEGMKMGGKLLEKGLRAAQFLSSQQVGEKAFLPRDAYAYFEQPDLINNLTATDTENPELTDSLIRSYQKGDKESFGFLLSSMMQENPDYFEPAQYDSLVVQDGKQVITDMYDREKHRQYIEKTITDPVEKFQQMQKLNKMNEIGSLPFEMPTIKSVKKIQSNKPTSAIKQAATALKKADVVELEDGTEMQDYDY